MLPINIEAAIKEIVVATSSGDYEAALSLVKTSRCSVQALRGAIEAYGQQFIAPPFADWDVIRLTDVDAAGWSIRAPLWSKEEGRSDLEMRFTAYAVGATAVIELDDLLVP